MEADDPLEILESASRTVRSERRELLDEAEAFLQFRDRVDSLDTNSVPTRSSPMLVGRPKAASKRLRKAYTDTVMSVPHFQKVYSESYCESLARELNEELAAALMTAEGLSFQLKQSLTDCVDEAIDARRSLIEFLETELAELDATKGELEEIVQELQSILEQPLGRAGFHVLELSRDRLRSLEADCEHLHIERQKTLQRNHRISVTEIDDTAKYLYGSCDTNHPILAAITAVCADIKSGYRTIDRRIATV